MSSQATPGTTMVIGGVWIVVGVIMATTADRGLFVVPFFLFGATMLVYGLYLRRRRRGRPDDDS